MNLLLQEAIILGDPLKKCDPGTWISEDGSCGCALGGALLAAGVTPEEFTQQWQNNFVYELPCIKARWPWLTYEHVVNISNLYEDASRGKATIYDVAAYVRSVEPEPVSTHLTLDARERVVVA